MSNQRQLLGTAFGSVDDADDEPCKEGQSAY